MKINIDHKAHIMRRWGGLFSAGEEILAAEPVMPRGAVRRSVAWTLPDMVAIPFSMVAQVAADFIGKAGEELVGEWAAKRRRRAGGYSSRFPRVPVVLVVTNRRYLLFVPVRSGMKTLFDPISSYPKGWIRSLEVTFGVTTHRLRLEFADGTAVLLQMTRSLGDPQALSAAITTLRSA
jgi:hypothetical protein